jgi:hypothetical protein
LQRHRKGVSFDRCHDQVTGVVERGAGDFFMPGANGNLVHTTFRGFARFAESAGQAGQILQFKRDMLKNVTGPSAFLNAAHETAVFLIAAAVFDQRGQPGREALVKAGNLVGGKVLQFADINPGFQHGTVSPHVRAAQGNDVANNDVFFLHAFFAQLRRWQCYLGQLVIINAFRGAWLTDVKKMSRIGTRRYRKRSSNLRLLRSSVPISRIKNWIPCAVGDHQLTLCSGGGYLPRL